MSKGKLIWDEWNTRHIKKHSVSVKEVEEGYERKEYEISSYSGRKIVFGKKKGRLLIIIVSFAKQERPYVVSARDTSKKERRAYEKIKTNQTI